MARGGTDPDGGAKAWLTEVAAAIQPHQMFKFGASFLYYRIVEDLSQQISVINSTARLGLAGAARASGSPRGPCPEGIPLTLGIAYRHQAPMTLSGNRPFRERSAAVRVLAAGPGDDGEADRAHDFYVGLAYDSCPPQADGELEPRALARVRSDQYIGDKGLIITVHAAITMPGSTGSAPSTPRRASCLRSPARRLPAQRLRAPTKHISHADGREQLGVFDWRPATRSFPPAR